MGDFHANRLSGIGSSDAAVILGLSSFKKTPMDLWLEKTQQREPVNLDEVQTVRWGTILEPVVADEFARNHPDTIVRRRQIMRSKAYPFALAHVDRMVKLPSGERVPLEVKTSRKWDDWKDGVPAYYVPQVQHQLLVSEASHVFVAVLLGGQEYREYLIERDQAYIDILIAEESAFWQHVVQKTPPPPRTYADVCALYPEATKGVKVAADETLENAARELALVRANKAAIKTREDELKLLIGQAMGNAETLVNAGGEPLLNYKNVEKDGLDGKKLQLDHPEIVEQYKCKISYREMRTLKALKAAA